MDAAMDAGGEEGGMTYGEVVDYFNSLQDPPAQERIDCIIPYLISLLPAPFVPAPPDAAGDSSDSEDDHFSFTSSDDSGDDSAAADVRSIPSPPGDGEDHISRLADDLLSEIISRLSTKEAARTMALSTRWRRVWAKTSLLVDDAHLRDADNEVSLVRAISRCVDAHPGPVRGARITHVAFYHHEYVLRRLVASLADKNVEDLILFNRPWPLNMPLPDDIFRCAYLRRLYLGAWMFPEVAAAAFVNLRELGLFHCIILDRDFDALLSLCSKLEVLSLSMSYNCPSRLRISSPSLRVAVEWMSSLDEIVVDDAPYLERLLLQAIPITERTPIKIVSAPRLEVLGILDLHLHELEIGGTTIRPGMWMFVKSSAKLPSLKILAVKVCLAIEWEIKLLMTLLKCFPHLETLHIKSIPPCASPDIVNCVDVWGSLGSCECLKSHLKTVSLQGFQTQCYEVLCLNYLVLEGEVLETVAFFCEDKVSFAAKDDEAAEIKLMFPKDLGKDRWSFQSAIDLSLDDPFFYAVEN